MARKLLVPEAPLPIFIYLYFPFVIVVNSGINSYSLRIVVSKEGLSRLFLITYLLMVDSMLKVAEGANIFIPRKEGCRKQCQLRGC